MKSVRTQSFSGPYFPAFGLNTERYSDAYLVLRFEYFQDIIIIIIIIIIMIIIIIYLFNVDKIVKIV